MIRSKREFRNKWKTALTQPIDNGKEVREFENYRGSSLLAVLGEIYSEMLANKLRHC
jgi:hypothetical protein